MMRPNLGDEKLESLLQAIRSTEGGKALKLLRDRERLAESIAKREAARKEKIKGTLGQLQFDRDDKPGQMSSDQLEQRFKEETAGLVTREEFIDKRRRIHEAATVPSEVEHRETVKKRPSASAKNQLLSFVDEDDAEDSEIIGAGISDEKGTSASGEPKKGYYGKDKTARTEFLLDTARDAEVERKKLSLIEEFNRIEMEERNKEIEVHYSYWDGSGYSRRIKIPQGYTIRQFLENCLGTLSKEFMDLKHVAADSLMFIKEDMIIPQNISFYDLIKARAQGKRGAIFRFDVNESFNLYGTNINSANEQSHIAKVVEKKWYEKNKHIFPASRWETYDASKFYQKAK